MGFHPELNYCVPADRVGTCNRELQLLAKQYRNAKPKADYDDDDDEYLYTRFMDLSFRRHSKRKNKIIYNTKY